MINHRTVIPLPAEHAAQAEDLLGRAFADDPLMSFWLPEPAQRHRQVPRLMRFVVRYSLKYGTVETTEQAEGIACWLPPGEVDYHYGGVFRAGWFPLPFRSGLRNYVRMFANEEHAHLIRLRACPGPHWYLWTLGVEPARQGQGIGGKLLSAGLERSDAQGLPCYLETHNPRNVPIYQHFGFRVFEESIVPNGELRIWGMLRPPSL
jgi:GNAT superfamily N-acetyltransferase